MTASQRRVAVIADAGTYVGPELARHLAARDHDLVLGDPDDALVAELQEVGSQVVAVPGVRNLAKPESAPALFTAALDRFGRVDAAVAASGRIVTGRFVDSTLDDLQKVVTGCLEAPDHFLKAAVQVNAVGTNFMDFPDFIRSAGAEDPAVRAKLESRVPLGRLGTMAEAAAFCMPFLDGTSRFTTGQFVAYAGGWA